MFNQINTSCILFYLCQDDVLLPAIQPTSPVMQENKEMDDININYVNGRTGIVSGSFMERDRNRAAAQYNPSFFPRNEHLFKRWVAESKINF